MAASAHLVAYLSSHTDEHDRKPYSLPACLLPLCSMLEEALATPPPPDDLLEAREDV